MRVIGHLLCHHVRQRQSPHFAGTIQAGSDVITIASFLSVFRSVISGDDSRCSHYVPYMVEATKKRKQAPAGAPVDPFHDHRREPRPARG
ncbi:hypothetical protein BQ8794_40043 [Mesorhizobium prunaredense]|uniref:Uncharacterized protein n=1 Tax=Mesorhizobium prunaredense TaxID=1631249 RepID=A0A1R3VGC3_9HYPH|nr:hypothetical protein BQ8794_40043 [Mesorhizobium prunaredense]